MPTEDRISEIGGFWLSKRERSPFWHITWFDAGRRQTRRLSTGERDLRPAEIVLAQHVALNSAPRDEKPADALIADVLMRYWLHHARHKPSHEQARVALALWNEYWGNKTVSDITPHEQIRFVAWLREYRQNNPRKGRTDAPMTTGYINRVLTVGRAALNRAQKLQELAAAPFIFPAEGKGDKRKHIKLSKDQLKALIMAALDYQPHMVLFILISLNTLARPEAVLELAPQQTDHNARLIDLNPPGRARTKKGRPIVPMTDTIFPFLTSETPEDETEEEYQGRMERPFILWHGKPVKSIKRAFAKLVKTANLPEGTTPYSLRHTMARELRTRGVPWEEIQGMLGHKIRLDDSSSATEAYAEYDPNYLSLGRKAIDALFKELCVPLALHSGKMDLTKPLKGMVGATGIEPVTPTMSR